MKIEEKARFTVGNLSDVGMVRESNQDYYGRYSGDFGELLLVCDGMGGYKGGEVASQVAVETIASHFQKLGAHFQESNELHQALSLAQQNIAAHAQHNPEMSEMGTTAVVLLIRGEHYWIAWIGDSRIYLRRGGEIEQISRDHSLVQEMVDHGLITEIDAQDHPRRNIITRSLGVKPHPADVKGPLPIYQDDVFLLCSDGLTDYLTANELNAYLAQEPEQACRELVDEANRRGGKDNTTVQILKVNSGKRYKAKKTLGSINLLTLILAFFATVMGLAATLSLMSTFHLGFFKKNKYVKPSSGTEFITSSPDSIRKDSLKIRESEKDKKNEAKESAKDKQEKQMVKPEVNKANEKKPASGDQKP